MLRRAVLFLLLSLALAGAHAQFRTLPADAKRATLNGIKDATATIDGKNLRLSPGAQIRDGHNMIILPTAVPRNLLVKYLLDAQGQVFRIWILSPAEAAQPDPK